MPTNTFRPLFTQLSANTSAFGDSAGKSECHMSRSGGYNVTGFGGFTSDASWTRRMVLTKEGALVVLDAISPGASTQLKAGWVGLPIWQLNCNCSKNATPTVCAPMAGKPDAFDLKHFERTTDQWQRSLAPSAGKYAEGASLLAKFGSAPGRTFGVAPGFNAPGSMPRPFSGGRGNRPCAINPRSCRGPVGPQHCPLWSGDPWQTL